MTERDPHRSHQSERPAEVAQGRQPIGGGAAGEGDSPDAGTFINSDTALGGADAVQKTSYVVGRGTEPGAQNQGSPIAQTRAGGGPNYVAWGIGALAAVIALVYLFGLIT